MTISASLVALALASMIVIGGTMGASAEAWRTYVNDRFGAAVEYPDRFSVRDAPPANSDGQRFHTADRRATLAVYGFFNVQGETPRQMMEGRKATGTRYTLADARDADFALSGLKGDRIVYTRCLRSRASPDVFACFDLDYPAADRAAFDPIVKRIAGSLRAGKPL